MKPTKKEEADILNAYNAYWSSYLKGDVETMQSLLDEAYTQVGSAEAEVFFTKKNAVQFLYDTIDQVAGKLEMRSRNIQLERQENIILIHELCDLYALAGHEFIFYAKFRASTIMQNKKDGWKIIHQHSSFPDARAEDGQNIAIDKIAEENRELREAVYRRTVEIENKNRELEIETALEKVRVIALAMKEPADMLDVCKIISVQLEKLGIKEIRNVQTAIFYESKRTYMNYEFYTKHDKKIITETSYTNHEVHRSFADKMLKGKGEFYSTHIGKHELKDWIAYQKSTNVFIDSFLETAPSLNYYWFSLGPVALGISTYIALNNKELELFRRFLHVFELAYRRYLDIETAEAQAREAEIELALERVRARTMAMQKSEQLAEVSHIINEQLQQLNFKNYNAGFFLNYRDSNDFNISRSDSSGLMFEKTTIPYFDHPVFNSFIDAKEKGLDFFTVVLTADEKNKWVEHSLSNFQEAPADVKEFLYNSAGYAISCALMKHAGLFIENFNGLPFSKQENAILLRFGNVFEQTYTRFLDLQKAEAQAREAKIEASLERVRAQALGMRKPEDLPGICEVLFGELTALGFTSIRNAMINIHNDEEGSFLNYDYSETAGKTITKLFYNTHPVIENQVKQSRSSKDAFSEAIFTGKDLEEWKKFRKEYGEPDDPKVNNINSLFYYFYSIGTGVIGISAYSSIAEEKRNVLKRFRNVFDLAYRRFIDIEQAEAQAREAKIEASLERMRSVAMSIRKSEELILVAESMYKELWTLGFANIRNAQLVIKIEGDDSMYLVCIYAPDKSEVLKENRYTTSPIIQQLYDDLDKSSDALYQKEISGKDFEEWVNWRRSTTSVTDSKLLKARSVSFYLYSIGDGHLGISSYNAITNEQLEVLKRFRNVFELSYRRFMDIAKSEEQALKLHQEKERLELALSELQAAQKQLIQSEKMASLGELTAGIAHEIQNPLNFVNNFSELNKELLEELNGEIDKGNFDEVKTIAHDVIANEEKINHHGKRADAIVKGMLQHSRTSNGQKESTDINALADEYLRLAYHGLRARDKSFNAKFTTDFDESIGNINIIAQDIGRVILNLITNAFYAVAEKKKQMSETYEAEVSVTTKKVKDKVEIRVSDNGNGIPQKVLDKIFQPFFTTKPTGEGTGLGLSLSYDIVKAHGGELKVETGEGKGAQFIIEIPV